MLKICGMITQNHAHNMEKEKHQLQLQLQLKLMNKIKQSMAFDCLDHMWKIRRYIFENADEDNRELLKISVAPFKYVKKWLPKTSDLSLLAVCSTCNQEELAQDTEFEDKKVTVFSHIFNQTISSNRALFTCYDCGTNARAIFFSIIGAYRNGGSKTDMEMLSIEEINRMTKMYSPSKNTTKTINECWSYLKNAEKNCVVICSIGYDGFGHVWIMEKKIGGNKTVKETKNRHRYPHPIYRHYQSSLRSHLVIDHIHKMDYLAKPNLSIDIDEFFSDLRNLMQYRSPSDDEYQLFCKLFSFQPPKNRNFDQNNFCYTYVEY